MVFLDMIITGMINHSLQSSRFQSSMIMISYDFYASGYPLKQDEDQEDVPFVVTSGNHEGYTGSFIHYSPEDILSIVRVTFCI